MTEPTVHALKTTRPYYEAVVAGMKTFDIRTFDRTFQVGDWLLLQESGSTTPTQAEPITASSRTSWMTRNTCSRARSCSGSGTS